MKVIFNLTILCLLLTACNKTDFDNSITSKTNLQELLISDDTKGTKDGKDISDKGKETCFALIYPINITMPDASLLSGEKEELWEAVKDWYLENPESKKKPSIKYPIEILWLADDIVKGIKSKEEMLFAKKYCDVDKKSCFKLVYPISWNMPDETNISMLDPKDWNELKAWYEMNPNSEEKPILNYPVDVEYKDGKVVSVIDESKMIILKKDCN